MKVKNSIIVMLISVTMILIMVATSIGTVYAATASELKNQQSELDKQIKETNSELAGTKSQMTDQLNQINKLNSEISVVEDEISTLNSQISSLEGQISEKDQSIKEQEEKYAVQKELLDKRLVALYESGNMSYLDMLLQADGLADFISKYYTIEILAQSDEELLAKIDATKNQIVNEKADLENLRNEIQTSKTAVEGKKSQLASSVSKKQSIVANLSAEEKELQEQLEELEAEKREITNQLAALARKNNYVVVEPSAAGYGTPLAGRTKANITCGFYGYSGHTGVDFAVGSGTPALAVKSGTVVISKACMRNGRYVSYGEYVGIDHHDGTVTIYAHLSSRSVSVGQSVSQGQQIGLTGSTGNSTGPHLHFEVRVNGRAVNPTAYLP